MQQACRKLATVYRAFQAGDTMATTLNVAFPRPLRLPVQSASRDAGCSLLRVFDASPAWDSTGIAVGNSHASGQEPGLIPRFDMQEEKWQKF